MDTNDIPGHHISDWVPEKDPVLVKHLGKLDEELKELLDVYIQFAVYPMKVDKTSVEDEIADCLAMMKESADYLDMEPIPGLVNLHYGMPETLTAIFALQICISRIHISGIDEKRPPEYKETNREWLYAAFCDFATAVGHIVTIHDLNKEHIVEREKRKRALKREWLRRNNRAHIDERGKLSFFGTIHELATGAKLRLVDGGASLELVRDLKQPDGATVDRLMRKGWLESMPNGGTFRMSEGGKEAYRVALYEDNPSSYDQIKDPIP